ncbi:MAG: 2Fe-2S iron-sulfur cluster-binding protein [Chitinophagales bacterium]
MGLFDFFKKKKNTTTSDNTPSTPSVSTKKTKRQFQYIKIAKVVKETPHAISVYLDIPEKLQEQFQYEAGQYVTLKYSINGENVLRSYSISSSPDTDDYFRICIKRKIGGKLSDYLVHVLRQGDELTVYPPLGHFTPKEEATKNYCLYAGGSGITPMLSILKSVLAKKADTQVVLVYANRDERNIIYAQELKDLQTQYGERLQISHILDAPNANWSGEKGIFKAKDYANLLKKQYVSQMEGAEHFVCGPTLMMQEVENALKQELNVAASQVNIEYFDMEKQAQQGISDHIQKEITQTIESVDLSELAVGESAVQITVQNKQYNVIVELEDNILNAALNQGIDVPFSCEAGVCSTCRAKVTAGEVNMMECHSLSDSEIEEGYVLTCQAICTTQVVAVDFDV